MKERPYEGESRPGYGYRVLGLIRDNVVSFTQGKDVFYGIHRYPAGRIVCTCGHAAYVEHRDALLPANGPVACSHLTALFNGRVTEDRELSKRSYYAFSFGGSPDLPRALPYVELTAEGKKFFHWRWAARTMERT